MNTIAEFIEQLNRRADDHDGDVDLRLYYGKSDAKLDRAIASFLTTLKPEGEQISGMPEARISIIARTTRQTLRKYGHKASESVLPECIAADVERALVAGRVRDCGIDGGPLTEERDCIGSAYTRPTQAEAKEAGVRAERDYEHEAWMQSEASETTKRLNALRLAAFRSNSEADRSTYFNAVSKAFQNGELVAASALRALLTKGEAR